MKQEELLTRIRRIRGQVEGIERMMVEQRSCLEIVQQVAAVKSALGKLGGMILAAESCRKLNKKNTQDFSKIINELVKNL